MGIKNKGFQLDSKLGYFRNQGVDVMAFDDIYPAGHQSGVSIIMHGRRIATSGDVRFEPTPGQWQPVPKQLDRKVCEETNSICTTLHYPDFEGHLEGFNPMIYPDFEFSYDVKVQAEGEDIVISVDLDRPIPEKYIGKLCFNLELFPGILFGKTWIMDDRQGIFPRQPNGPVFQRESNYENAGDYENRGKRENDYVLSGANEEETKDVYVIAEGSGIKADKKQLTGENKSYNPMVADDLLGEPYAVGHRFTVCPEDDSLRFTVCSDKQPMRLYDGRMNHNNGWFVVSSELPPEKTVGALVWIITPNVIEDWIYQPVVQVSQVGYHPKQNKVAVIELDKNDTGLSQATLVKITDQGAKEICRCEVEDWGFFLRYHYLRFDFSDVREEGLYQVIYGDSKSAIFRISKEIYDRGVWQPVLEYFLPVQMCHMKVCEKYRVWHGHCHCDDARMAPINRRHIDGYVQGASTLTKYQPGDCVPGLNVGGWHDAGDFDLRVESQSGEAYNLASIYENFGVYYDATTIDQNKHLVEIHQPDGKNDILQQVEHGVLTVVGGYRSLGRLYRGIIANDVRQYVLLGDAANMTAGKIGDDDDRWVFTEENPQRELMTAAHLACAARVLRGFNDSLADDALEVAEELFNRTECTEHSGKVVSAKVTAAVELYLTTKDTVYETYIKEQQENLSQQLRDVASIVAKYICNAKSKQAEQFKQQFRDLFEDLSQKLKDQMKETPYGIPYRPYIWGAGWGIQGLAVDYYYLHLAYPDLFDVKLIYDSLHFILGCHPGSNTASFASGVGAKSMTTAYGANRADWSYIPGGVVSGTALIRPDFPEMLEFPFLWQQAEYVMGGGSSNYMFLVLAAKQLLEQD